MSRTITVLGLIQLFLVIAGFIALGVVMKFNGYPEEHPLGIRWNPFALWLRQYGLILLPVPVGWTIGTALAENRRFLFPFEVWIGLGIALPLTIASLFLYACCNPYSRTILGYFGY